MSPTFTVDISGVESNIGNFPNGIYEARVLEASLDIAQSSGEPVIRLEWEIHHPDLGNARVRDNLPYKFPAKVKAFYMAANELSHEDMQLPEHQTVEIDPDELVGLQLLVQLGEREGKAKDNTLRMYKDLSGAWYFPLSRTDLIQYADNPFTAA